MGAASEVPAEQNRRGYHLLSRETQASPIWREVTIEQREKIEQLAVLPPLQYETQRKEVAKALNVRVSLLGDYVDRVRPAREDDVKGQGSALNFPSLEPWPDPVAGEALVNDMTAAIKWHVILTEAVTAKACDTLERLQREAPSLQADIETRREHRLMYGDPELGLQPAARPQQKPNETRAKAVGPMQIPNLDPTGVRR